MRNHLTLVAAASVLALGIAACSTEADTANEVNEADVEVLNETDSSAAGANGAAASGTTWPTGSRIVVEDGVTYRIEPGGARVALGPSDSRIVVEGDTRFRVDPDGSRVRIDEDGAVIAIDEDGVDATVDVGSDTSVQVNTD